MSEGAIQTISLWPTAQTSSLAKPQEKSSGDSQGRSSAPPTVQAGTSRGLENTTESPGFWALLQARAELQEDGRPAGAAGLSLGAEGWQLVFAQVLFV